MKYFSVSFIQEKRDTNLKAIIISILFGDMKDKILSRLLIMCAFICLGFFMGQYELIYYAFLTFIIIPKVADVLMVISQINKNEASQMSKRPITVDFYGDHIVYFFGSTNRFKGNFEKHYAFSEVTGVVESKNAIAFSFGEKESLIIPKRALNNESIELIGNLIENLFKNKFVKVDL